MRDGWDGRVASVARGADGSRTAIMNMILEAKSLSVRRGGREVLAGVDLRIEGPGCTAIVGPNGAGKTTLLQTLLGLLPPDAGAVRVGGRDVRDIRHREMARLAAYVPQNVEGFGGFSVRDVVAAARYPHVHPLAPLSKADAAAVNAALDQCGLTGLADRTLHTLSGGERQKAWVAAALAQEAPLMLLDEPAAALDPRFQAELIGLIRRLAAEGRTLLVVAHDLNFAAATSGRIIALRGGCVAYDGPTAAFLTAERLESVFDTRFILTRCAETDRVLVGLAAME